MKPHNIITIVCLLLTAATASAQATDDPLLARYRQMALEYNDDLKAAAKNIEAGIELERAARADRIPTLSASGDFRYTGNPLSYTAELPDIGPLSLQGQEFKYGASATLSQPVYTGGRIVEAIRKAETETRISEAQHDLLHTAVCYQVDVQYWTTVARRERMSVAEEYLNAVADLERVVRERVEAGLCDRQELLTVEVKHNEARYRLLQARSDFETGIMALNALIGEPLDTRTPVGETVSRISAGEADIPDGEDHPEVRLAEERVKLQQAGLRLNDARYKPQLQVGANAGYYAPGYDFEPGLSPNYTVYAQLSVPIFNGGKRQRERSAAQHRIGMALDDLHGVETDLDLERRTARTSLAEAEERVELAASSLEKAFENERRATEKYAEGAISVSEVIDAQLYRQTAQENLVTAKAAARMHLAELSKACNAYRFQ